MLPSRNGVSVENAARTSSAGVSGLRPRKGASPASSAATSTARITASPSPCSVGHADGHADAPGQGRPLGSPLPGSDLGQPANELPIAGAGNHGIDDRRREIVTSADPGSSGAGEQVGQLLFARVPVPAREDR